MSLPFDAYLDGSGPLVSGGFTPASESAALARALRTEGVGSEAAQQELLTWVTARRDRLVPPEQMIAELKQVLSQLVAPAYPPADAPELQRQVVHLAIRYYYSGR